MGGSKRITEHEDMKLSYFYDIDAPHDESFSFRIILTPCKSHMQMSEVENEEYTLKNIL